MTDTPDEVLDVPLEELDALKLLAAGHTLDVMAHRLAVSDRTVRRRIKSACARFGVRTPIEAAVAAARQGLI